MGQIVISPSGNFYGSEQVLFEYIKTTSLTNLVIIPAKSLLTSYKSYERILAVKDNPETRRALGNNYLNFIYHYYTLYPDLTNRAEIAFKELGLKKMWPVGGKRFIRFASIIGFASALRLKKGMKKP